MEWKCGRGRGGEGFVNFNIVIYALCIYFKIVRFEILNYAAVFKRKKDDFVNDF